MANVQERYCTRPRGSACYRCSLCCPHGAISLEDGRAPSVDAVACRDCGICAGVCDAFSLPGLDLDDLHRRILRLAAAGNRVFLTCSKHAEGKAQPARNVVVLPCLSALSPAFLTMVLAESVQLSLACKLETCESCDLGGRLGGMLFPRAVEIAQERTGAEVLVAAGFPTDDTTEAERLAAAQAEKDDPTGRRRMLDGLAEDIAGLAFEKHGIAESGILQEYCRYREKNRIASRFNPANPAALHEREHAANPQGTLFPQFRMLAAAALAQPERAQRISLQLSRTDPGKCNGGLECVRRCPTGARFEGPEGKAALDPALCIGCGICTAVCPEGACSMETGTAQVFLQQ